MIRILLLLTLGFLFDMRSPQSSSDDLAMCHDPNAAVNAFARFADDADFARAHPAPLPLEVDHQGIMVSFPVKGGAEGRAYLMKSHAATDKYLFLFHEWWGLNDHMRQEASYWNHLLGINVMVVDLYDGQVATDAAEAGRLMQECDPERAKAIIEGAMAYVGEKADFRTMGWCFGGGWSLQASLLMGERAKGCVMYYGMPEKDLDRLRGLQTDVVFVHAERDQWITNEVVAGFERDMEKAGKKLQVFRYDADHAFANSTSPRFNEQASTVSREAVYQYLMSK